MKLNSKLIEFESRVVSEISKLHTFHMIYSYVLSLHVDIKLKGPDELFQYMYMPTSTISSHCTHLIGLQEVLMNILLHSFYKVCRYHNSIILATF